MKYYIGIDGGGTKTSVAVGDEAGGILHLSSYEGCSYQEIGVKAVEKLLLRAVRESLKAANVKEENCAGCCIGLPCFGENIEKDRVIAARLEETLTPIPVFIVNDGVVGWAGSLECQEGIHLVAGTGTIAIGCDANGTFGRCGGWCECFGDEGSCYWIGLRLMGLFSKEADGRIPKSPLYSLIREACRLEQDLDFIDIMLREVLPYRNKVAAFQKLAFQAAEQGDREVIALYREAAHELVLLVKGVRGKLHWGKEPIHVSYFGGLFHAEKYVLPVLEEELKKQNCILCRPKHTATEGALLLAVQKFQKEK